MTQEGDKSIRRHPQQEAFQAPRPQMGTHLSENLSSQAGDLSSITINKPKNHTLTPDVIQFLLEERAGNPDVAIGRHQHS